MGILKQLKMIFAMMLTVGIVACQPSSQTNDAKEQAMTQTAPVSGAPQISVQLWSVNKQIKQDFKGTLTAIADMGFQGVEFAGFFGPYQDDPQGLKAFLDGLGLQVSGAHVPMRLLTPEKFKQTVDYYAAIDTPMILVPSSKRAIDPERIDELISDMKAVQQKLAKYDIGFGFHNHGRELKPYKQTTFWDHIAASTNDDFILQLDVGWVATEGLDPVEYVNKYPGRTKTSHYKVTHGELAPSLAPFIGEDSIDWPAVINAQKSVGGTLWLVVEQELYPDNISQLDAVKRSKQGLDRILETL